MEAKEMPWDELMHKDHEQTPAEKVILNCIMCLSSLGRYQIMTPWEIYDLMVRNAAEIH